MIKAVWFDLYGTLVEKPYKHLKDPTYLLYEKLNKKPWFNFTFRQFCIILMTNYLDNTKDIAEYFWIKLKESEILDIDNRFTEDVQSVVLKDWTLEMLDKIKSKWKKIFLISNLSARYALWETMIKIKKEIDLILFSFLEWKIKPNEDLFQKVINKFLLNKDEIIFVWDSQKNDIFWANLAWIWAYHINDFRIRYKEILEIS